MGRKKGKKERGGGKEGQKSSKPGALIESAIGANVGISSHGCQPLRILPIEEFPIRKKNATDAQDSQKISGHHLLEGEGDESDEENCGSQANQASPEIILSSHSCSEEEDLDQGIGEGTNML